MLCLQLTFQWSNDTTTYFQVVQTIHVYAYIPADTRRECAEMAKYQELFDFGEKYKGIHCVVFSTFSLQ